MPHYDHDDDPGASLDTPIVRTTIDALQLDELDAFLDQIRTRRLLNVQRFAAIAAVARTRATAVEADKFAKAVARIKKMIDALEDSEMKCAAAINKLRSAAMEIED